MVKVAINGFGRIGRMSFRAMLDHPELDIVAVNDLTSADTLAYLFKYDSVHDNFDGEVHAEGDCIVVNGKKVKIYAERDPQNLPWKELGVDIVVESTGLFKKRDQMMKHINAGAKKVILTVPAGKADDVDATVVMGVNDNVLTKEMQLVSNASCTTNCLAPVAKVLNDKFGIKRGLMNTIHSYTNDPQRPAPCPCCRHLHHPHVQWCCQGCRPGYPRTDGQTGRLCHARSHSRRLCR